MLNEEHGSEKRYNARLVVKRFAQEKSIEFDEIFSLVSKLLQFKLFCLTDTKDLHLEQFNVKTTFLHRDLEEEIYMLQPQGYEVYGKDLVCILKKSLNGLKQAP